LVGVAAVVFVAGCGKSQSVTIASSVALDVTTLAVKTEPVVLSQEACPAGFQPFGSRRFELESMASYRKRLFTEGTDVKEGDVLFEIDPAPYEAALDSARASLARSEASLASAKPKRAFQGLVANERRLQAKLRRRGSEPAYIRRRCRRRPGSRAHRRNQSRLYPGDLAHQRQGSGAPR